jgi:hypothetical protein
MRINGDKPPWVSGSNLMYLHVYPGLDVLQEVGRVTIAGARLDVQMGFLWHYLDRSVSIESARSAAGKRQCDKVRGLANERLSGQMRDEVLAAVAAAEAARRQRNEIVHQDWLLRGPDAARPVSEIAKIQPADLAAYIEEWDRESKHSQDWRRVPARGTDVVPAQDLEELRQIERALAAATDAISTLVFRVASSRETGSPTGYMHPA